MKEGIDDYFTGDFLKAENIKVTTTATIAGVSEIELDDGNKPGLSFSNLVGILVLNKTNAAKIA